MTLILSGTDGVSDIDGTAATPAIRGTDANTGIFFPAADTIAFSEGGAEAMRIDSSGNVGIGTTSPAQKLDVAGNARVGGTTGQFFINASSTSQYPALLFQSAGTSRSSIFIDDTGATFPTFISVNTAAPLIFRTDSTERMRIDSSGNVGIGTTSPNGKLDITSTSAGATTNALFLTNASGSASTATNLVFGVSATPTTRNATIQAINAGGNAINLAFLTSNGDAPAERARITSGGIFCIGTSSSIDSMPLNVVGATAGQVLLRHSGSAHWRMGPDSVSNDFIIYSSSTGGVYVTNTGTSWNARSDERCKTDLIPIENGLDKVSTLRAVTGRYIEDEEGFSRSFLIAQDVQAVLPEAVDSNREYLGLSYTDVIPLLVAAIKNLKTINDAQTTRIETLEAEVAALKAKE